MNKFFIYFISILLGFTVACSTGKSVKGISVPAADDEKIFSSHEKPPEWVYSEPESDSTNHYFTGLSSRQSTEKNARSDALNNSIQNVVKYLGSAFMENIEKISTSYGLSSQIVDPTDASRNFQEQIAAGMAKNVKAKSWYVEKWKTMYNDVYFLVRILSKVPIKSIDEVYKNQMNSEIKELRDKRDKIKDKKAKEQFEKAMDAFSKARDEGFGLQK